MLKKMQGFSRGEHWQQWLRAGFISLSFCLSTAVLAATPLAHKTQEDVLQWVDQFQPNSLKAGKGLTFSALIDELNLNRVVYVGEIHDRYDHHLTQLAILKALHQRNPRLAIGVEWFQQSFQGVVNDFLAGKIDEETLLRRTEYFERWRYDYRMLRPIMEYAKANQLPVIALNAPSELTRKVSKDGLEALNVAERAQLPKRITPPDDAYRSRLEKIFTTHATSEKKQLNNFMMVQRIWDETMAQNITRFLNPNPAWRMVVFSGSGHISYDAGIPQDVAQQLPQIRQATVISSDARDVERDMVDYAVLTRPWSLPPTGKLGVWLENKGKSVVIGEMAKNSAARKAGLQTGDKILTLDGVTIHSTADLTLELAQTQPGQVVKMAIERKGKEKPQAYDVTLH